MENSFHDKEVYICPNCNINFSNFSEFDKHIKDQCTPSKGDPYCIIYNEPREGEKILKKLNLTVDEYFYNYYRPNKKRSKDRKINKRYTCYSCAKVLRNNLRFMSHVRHKVENEWRENDNINDFNICYHCYRHYDSPFHLQCHLETVHTLIPAPTCCRICDLNFSTDEQLLKHMKNNHIQNEMPYFCKQCSYRTSFYQEFTKHFREVHEHGNSLLCLFCLAVHHTANSHLAHVLQHMKKSVRCNLCRLQFLTIAAKNYHISNHHKPCVVSLKKIPANLNKYTIYIKVTATSSPKKIHNDGEVHENFVSLLKGKKEHNGALSLKYGLVQKELKFIVSLKPEQLQIKNRCCECGKVLLAEEFKLHYQTEYCCQSCPYKSNCETAANQHIKSYHTKPIKKEIASPSRETVKRSLALALDEVKTIPQSPKKQEKCELVAFEKFDQIQKQEKPHFTQLVDEKDKEYVPDCDEMMTRDAQILRETKPPTRSQNLPLKDDNLLTAQKPLFVIKGPKKTPNKTKTPTKASAKARRKLSNSSNFDQNEKVDKNGQWQMNYDDLNTSGSNKKRKTSPHSSTVNSSPQTKDNRKISPMPVFSYTKAPQTQSEELNTEGSKMVDLIPPKVFQPSPSKSFPIITLISGAGIPSSEDLAALSDIPMPPTKIWFSEVTNGSITVNWLPPLGCHITQFQLIFQGSGLPTTQYLPGAQTTVRLIGLRSKTFYKIKLYTLNKEKRSDFIGSTQRTLLLRDKKNIKPVDEVIVLDEDAPQPKTLTENVNRQKPDSPNNNVIILDENSTKSPTTGIKKIPVFHPSISKIRISDQKTFKFQLPVMTNMMKQNVNNKAMSSDDDCIVVDSSETRSFKVGNIVSNSKPFVTSKVNGKTTISNGPSEGLPNTANNNNNKAFVNTNNLKNCKTNHVFVSDKTDNFNATQNPAKSSAIDVVFHAKNTCKVVSSIIDKVVSDCGTDKPYSNQDLDDMFTYLKNDK